MRTALEKIRFRATTWRKWNLCFLWVVLLVTSVPAATYHVDQRHPQASDANPGTKDLPWKTLARACESAQAGDTAVIHPGVYREPLIPRHSGEPGKPITFQGAPLATRSPGQHAVIKGSEVIDGFEKEGDRLWVRRPWRGLLYFTEDMEKISVARFRDSARQEQVFVNDEPLDRVPDREHLSPGTFLWSREELVVHPPEGVHDLNAALVEVPNRNKVAGAWPQSDPRGIATVRSNPNQFPAEKFPNIQHIVIRGLHFRHAAHTLNRSGVQLEGDHWTIEDCIVAYMNCGGIGVHANHATVRRCHVHHNGQGGIGGGGSHVLIEENVTTHNNRKNFSTSWGGAGNKFAYAENYVVRNNISAWNRGSGIWFDIDCRNNRFEENVTVGNWNVNAGYFYEISFDGVIRNNISFGQYGDMAGSYGAGVVSSECDGVLIEDNILIASEGGVSILGGGRERWHARNNLVQNNLIVNSRRYALHIRHRDDDPAASPEANNRFIDNIVLHRAAGAPYLIGDRRPKTLEEMERDFPLSKGNLEVSGWRELENSQRERLDEALGRIVQALFPPEFPAPSAPKVALRDVAYLDDNRRTTGYLLETSDGPAWLLDVFAPGAWTLGGSGFIEPGTVRIWSGLPQRWRAAKVEGETILLELPEGVHYVTGVPLEARFVP